MLGNEDYTEGCKSVGVWPAELDPGRMTPLKFWEFDHFFTCPVIGMCLTFSEQKQLLKKVNVSLKKKSAFDIHEMLVASSKTENRLSRRVDALLDRKFGREAASLRELGQYEFMAHWRSCCDAGDCAGALWAAGTRPDLPEECRREIFGAVHMAMHMSAKQKGKLKQRLTRQEETIGELRRDLGEAVRARREQQKENDRLARMNDELQAALAAAENARDKVAGELAGLKGRQQMAERERENRRLTAELDAMSGKIREGQRQRASLEEQNNRLSTELDRQKEANARLNAEAQRIIRDAFAVNRCDPSCPSFDLCQKRVLIVGGITRMESLYRQFIEGSGGVFEYHDGYMKKGVKQLENRLRRADVVLCPVSCNSHAACSLVKNLGKKHNKPVHMLANSSLTTVSQAICAS